MSRFPISAWLALLLLSTAVPAHGDVWRWVDANGDTHYVDSEQAIYTWMDEQGKVHYSDKPDHEDAVRVQLFWHSPGTVADLDEKSQRREADTGGSGEAPEGREAVVAHNCKRANEILASYENAPKLYRTDADGKRHILNDAEYAAELASAREKTRLLCSQ